MIPISHGVVRQANFGQQFASCAAAGFSRHGSGRNDDELVRRPAVPDEMIAHGCAWNDDRPRFGCQPSAKRQSVPGRPVVFGGLARHQLRWPAIEAASCPYAAGIEITGVNHVRAQARYQPLESHRRQRVERPSLAQG